MQVSPFRYLRISGCVPLPAAFRSLPRLSSALSAKASALRPFLLDLSPPHSVAAVLPPARAWLRRRGLFLFFHLGCLDVSRFLFACSVWSFQGAWLRRLCAPPASCRPQQHPHYFPDAPAAGSPRRLLIAFLQCWQPPAFPCRPQHSILGRLRLNHRVRDGNGCLPQAHRHQLFSATAAPSQPSSLRPDGRDNPTVKHPLLASLERR